MTTPVVNLYLVGFMGTGKTTVGRAIAYRLGAKLIDVDATIEREQGKPVSKIFEEDGEPVFRKLERDFIESGHPARGCIVACGGGLVVQPGMLELLDSRGVVICLHASLETVLKRTRHSKSRPLLNVEDPLARMREIYSVREPIYRKAGTLLLTDNRSLPDVIAHAMRVYKREAADFLRTHRLAEPPATNPAAPDDRAG
ncbi:shikimate kinase [Ereboglobus luteus]|uniref:Shikimate kinase n=1 Tax=Ereboglobus luteus TaxID=1796921 RepID=A0A2U8E7C2_9BACT|nr:shikimate kinase [Ereboglobus luteus]AWI10675.1 shikimate kinase [Ereboglobus luteus]